MLGQWTVGLPMPLGVLGAVVAWLRPWVFTAFIQPAYGLYSLVWQMNGSWVILLKIGFLVSIIYLLCGVCDLLSQISLSCLPSKEFTGNNWNIITQNKLSIFLNFNSHKPIYTYRDIV